MQEREAAIKTENGALKLLIEANTVLTQEEKELTKKRRWRVRSTPASPPDKAAVLRGVSGDCRFPRLRTFFGLVAGGVRLRGVDDDDRAWCVVDALLADRAEHQFCEPAVSA